MIDILLAAYQGADYIVEQLRSLMQQTYPHFRILIWDDGSQDETVVLIEEFSKDYPGKIKLIKGGMNLGARGNFDTLLGYAEADYILFSDGDDVWLPTKIEETLAVMQKNEALYGKETPLLIHTDLQVVDKNLQTLSPSFWHYSRLNPVTAKNLNRLLTHNVVTGCTMMINRPLLQLAAPIPQEAIMHDWWIALTASAFGKIDVVPNATLLYRQHGKNDVGAKNWRSWRSYTGALKKGSSQKGRKEMRKLLLRTVRQSSIFLSRYESRCTPRQKLLLKAYAKLETGTFWQKRMLIMKHRFFKNTFLKNIALLLLI